MITIGFACITIGIVAIFIKSDLFLLESSWETLNTTTNEPNEFENELNIEETTVKEPDFGRDSISQFFDWIARSLWLQKTPSTCSL